MSRLSVAGIFTAAVFVLIAAASGPGSRLGLWHFRTGFTMLRFSAYGACVSGLISLYALAACLIRRRTVKGAGAAAVGLIFSLVVIAIPLMWSLEAKRVPRIHDITTDFEDPPSFKDLRPARPTPEDYPGAEASVPQRDSYPEIKPLRLGLAPDKAYDAALKTARELNWEVVDSDPGALRFEAVDTTLWYGFKDDIAVRVTPLDGASRIDVRSVSRVGISDVGTNARRIRRYFDALRKKAQN